MKLKSILAAAAAVALTAGAASAATLFSEDFENEGTPGISELNFDAFTQFDVLSGSVDLIYGPSNSFGLDCYLDSDKCVDLDGSTLNSGFLVTSDDFTFDDGVDYILSFAMSGNQRNGSSDTATIEVKFGALLNETITLAGGDDWDLYSYTFTGDGTSGPLGFQNSGGDNIGIMLDSISLSEVPLPAGAWLLLGGLGGLAAMKRRKKS